VIFSGATPANTTFVSLPIPSGGVHDACGWRDGRDHLQYPHIGKRSERYFCSHRKVNTNTALGTLINDTATVNSITPDPNPGNNSASSSIAVGTSADLSIAVADSPDPVIAGNNITYTQTVTNPGPAMQPT